MGTQTAYTQGMTKGGVMTGAPFKRGDRVVLKQGGLERVFGTVFWVKQNEKDDFRWSRKTRGYVKVASKGGWTVGVEWDSEFRYPILDRVIPRKFVGAGAVRLFTDDDAQVEQRMLERYPDPLCVFCGEKATKHTEVVYDKPYKGRLKNARYLEYCCDGHYQLGTQKWEKEGQQ